MRVIAVGTDENIDNFATLEKSDEEEKKKVRRKKGYKENRGLASVSKVKIEDENVLKALDKARADYLKKNPAVREKYFGVQNMVLLLAKKRLEDVNTMDDIKETPYKTGKATKKFIIVSFRNEESMMFNKLSQLAEEQRNKLNLFIKGFGVSNVIHMLVVDELLNQKYLKKADSNA